MNPAHDEAALRILYLSESYIPSRRANSVHVVRMCAALARAGHDVCLVGKHCPERFEPGVDDDHAFYGVAPRFPVVKLPRPLGKGGGLVFGLRMRRLLAAKREAVDLIYSRDIVGAWLARRLGVPLIFEAHVPPRGRWSHHLHAAVMRSPSLRRLVVISHALAGELERRGLTPRHGDVAVVPDAADALDRDISPAADGVVPPALAETAGTKVGYVGHLYPGRGFATVRRLAERLPELGFHVIGGEDATVAELRTAGLPPNLHLHGFVQPAHLAHVYAHLDVLLMPYERQVMGASHTSELSRWMSPMKMFEYMSAGRAIVASDLPVLREVLEHDSNALLVAPDDLDAWVETLRRLDRDPALRRRLGDRARRDWRRAHTWDARAARALEGVDLARHAL